ncbi:hypothetical protein OHA27_36905 [Streptomyces sp. NBC_01619]|uniref:hypothetical protein n=1 Tax=Streptomyces sp. NBC_01619 TaxID=2975901 RepID=UPI00225319C1|nr:hypothetical protein [Streptomyces sp. NBC_01619]MCX4515747.1 hypothetical protein [Streptomyces sp. NBC_01619]
MNDFPIFGKAGLEAVADEFPENNMRGTVLSEDGKGADGVHAADESVPPQTTGIMAGAAAVVCAGLGLVSLTGVWLAPVLADRQRLIGQINGSTQGMEQQIEQIFGAAWHTTAVVNGAFAIAAILLAAFVLIGAKSAAPWVRMAVWGGLALGVLGLLIASGTWFDLFGDLPQVPPAPTPAPKPSG